MIQLKSVCHHLTKFNRIEALILTEYFFFIFPDPRLKQLSDNKMAEWRRWFDTRLDDAIEAASTQQHPEIESKQQNTYSITSKRYRTRMISIAKVYTYSCTLLIPAYSFHQKLCPFDCSIDH